VAAVVVLLLAASSGALAWFHAQGWLLYYGDAEAHLNIARRIADTRTPNYEQIGTVWLPLPHWILLPLVKHDGLWRSGLAGGLASAACFVVAGVFLFCAARRLFGSAAAGFTAVMALALNPNAMYLQSTAMTEPVFLASLFLLLYFAVLFHQSQSVWAAVAAGVAALAATLTRYEGWFLLPFAALWIAWGARRRWWCVALFLTIAGLGPLYWLAHNWWCYGDWLEFWRGPYSAQAIYQRSLAQGMQRYAGDGDWAKALLYFREAARLACGWPLIGAGLLGMAACLGKRVVWPVLLLLPLPVFYIASMHSGGTPIYVPHLWPNSYYNTRYGLAALPLLALGAAGLVAVAPGRWRKWMAATVLSVVAAGWLAYPRAEAWICWKESQVNSEARRAWTREAADFLRVHYRGGGIFTSFGDLAGIYRQAGIPLREILHEGNEPYWQGAAARPDLLLREEWVVSMSGDKVSAAMVKTMRHGPRYLLMKQIAVKGAPVIEIYQRQGSAYVPDSR